ncbi:unnamed protein product, partial [Meganyctiphanes norvegica]
MSAVNFCSRKYGSAASSRQTSIPGTQFGNPFITRSSGSYTPSYVLTCTNGSDASPLPMLQPSGSYTSSTNVGSQIASENSFPPTLSVAESCKFNNTINAGIPSLPRSSESVSLDISANCNSTLECSIPSLPHSSGSCTKSTKSTTSTVGAICRICHDGDTEEKLVSPCLCAGTQGLVHKTCLERWLSTASYDNCELCHFPFHLKKKARSFFEFLCHKWEPDMKRAVAGDLLCFLVLTPLTLVSAYLCGRGAIQYFLDRDYYHNRKQGSDHSDISIFTSPFSKRYRDREIVRERVILKTSLGAAYIEKENSHENEHNFIIVANEVESFLIMGVGVVVLRCMFLVIFGIWYHVKAFRRWQHVHQDLVLVDVSNPGPICRLNLSFISNNSPPNRSEFGQIYTLPESSYVDLDEQREQRLSLVPEVHNEIRRSILFSPSNNSSVGDSGRRMIISGGRRASECVRRLSESGRKARECVRRLSDGGRRSSESGRRSSILVSRRASEGGRRASIFSSCLIRDSSPKTYIKYEELSGKALLDTSNKSSIKKYAAVNSLNVSPSKEYLNVENTCNDERNNLAKKHNGACWIANEETNASIADTNNLPTMKKTKTSVSPVAPEVSIPIYFEDYESPESYRIACAMYAEAIYNGELAQITKNSPERLIGIHQFPFSPTSFNSYRRNSTRSTHL